MVVLLDLCLRARTIAASMVINGPEAIAGAPRRGSTAKEELSCLARNAGALRVRQGKKVSTPLLRHRRSRL